MIDLKEPELKLNTAFGLDPSNPFFRLELKVADKLDQLGQQGLRVDPVKLAQEINRIQKQLLTLQLDIPNLIGRPIQIGSQKQLSHYLFEERGFQPIVFTPKGNAV
jgi:DNA polymerase I-like protein with 3'-5' exonuclease and polymerase domains